MNEDLKNNPLIQFLVDWALETVFENEPATVPIEEQELKQAN